MKSKSKMKKIAPIAIGTMLIALISVIFVKKKKAKS